MKKKGDERKVKWEKKKKKKKRGERKGERTVNWIAFFFLWYFYSSPFLLLSREVSRDGSRRRGGGNDTPSVELKLSSSQKVTVRNDCGSHRCLHLSDLGSPDIGRGKKNEAKWLAGASNGSGVPFPSTEERQKKLVFGQVSWQTDDSHFTPG